MKKPLLVSSLWIATLAGAYMAGRMQPEPVPGSTATAPVKAGQSRDGGNTTGQTSTGAGLPGAAPWAAGGSATANPDSPDAAALAKLQAALANTNTIERSRDLLAALDDLSSDGLRAAADILRSQDDGMGNRWQMMLLMYAWGRKDPAAALAYNEENDNGRANFSVLGAWAEVSPDKAIAWALANPEPGENGQPGENWQMLGVIHGLSKVDPGKAAKAVEQMSFGRSRSEALDMVLNRYWRKDPQAVQAWAESIADDSLRGGATSRVAARLAESDPEKAATWVTALKDPATKSKAMAGMVEEWARRDPNAAGEWLNAIPASPATDEPRESFARAVDEKDPQSAMAWAGTITDGARRDRTMDRIASQWLRRDPETARAALRQMPNLPAAVQSKLGQ